MTTKKNHIYLRSKQLRFTMETENKTKGIAYYYYKGLCAKDSLIAIVTYEDTSSEEGEEKNEELIRDSIVSYDCSDSCYSDYSDSKETNDGNLKVKFGSSRPQTYQTNELDENANYAKIDSSENANLLTWLNDRWSQTSDGSVTSLPSDCSSPSHLDFFESSPKTSEWNDESMKTIASNDKMKTVGWLRYCLENAAVMSQQTISSSSVDYNDHFIPMATSTPNNTTCCHSNLSDTTEYHQVADDFFDDFYNDQFVAGFGLDDSWQSHDNDRKECSNTDTILRIYDLLKKILADDSDCQLFDYLTKLSLPDARRNSTRYLIMKSSIFRTCTEILRAMPHVAVDFDSDSFSDVNNNEAPYRIDRCLKVINDSLKKYVRMRSTP